MVLGEDVTGGRKRERPHFVFHSIFLLKFYYPLLSFLSFICSSQVIALFVCVSLLLDPQADSCKIYLHCLLFLIFSNEVPIWALGSVLLLLHSIAHGWKVTPTLPVLSGVCHIMLFSGISCWCFCEMSYIQISHIILFMLHILFADLGFHSIFSFESYHMNNNFVNIGVEDEIDSLFSKG